MLPAHLIDPGAVLDLFEDRHDLAFTESEFLQVETPLVGIHGPQHKARSVEVDAELRVTGPQCSSIEAELSALNDRYADQQELAKKYGAMEVADEQAKTPKSL